MRVRNSCILLCAALLAAACSTTRRLGTDEVLYTGVRKIRIEPDSGVVLSAAAESAVKEPLSVAPNNPLYSPYLRTPLPIGLWAYNYLYTPKERGFKYWLYKRLAKQPVLISKVQPGLRTKVAEQVLENYGYFGSQAEDSLLYRKHGRKAKVYYTLRIAPPWYYSNISYPQAGGSLQPLIDSMRATSLLRVGAQYNMDSLTLERKRISQLLRNRGYYYFRPEYMEYLADTTVERRRVDLRLNLKPNVPEVALKPYRVGDITVRLTNIKPGPADTFRLRDVRVIAQRPMKIRPKILSRTLSLEPGQLFTVDAQNRTQTALNKLGIFRSVNLGVTPLDSLRGADTLDVVIDAQFDYPLEAALETDVTSKSNSFIGPGITFKVSNNNLFRGGEVLAVKLNGSYEWQTGHQADGSSSKFNSYEYGADVSVEMPRLLFVNNILRRLRHIRRRKGKPIRQRYATPTTLIKGSFDVLNRSGFFQRHIVSGELTYKTQPRAIVQHQFSPLILQYEYMKHMTPAFTDLVNKSPYLLVAMSDQFVPKMRYTFTYQSPARLHNPIFWQVSVSEAANLLSLGYMAFGEKWNDKEKTMFKNPYAQFLKVETDYSKTWQVTEHSTLVGHVNMGVVWAYGNAISAPYSEQFYVGGANSIRAFNVRSIGPGRYHAQTSYLSYLDQTGDLKLQMNLEYRPRMFGNLYGALFLDAGNVWTLRSDSDRPGAVFKPKNMFKEMAVGTGIGIRYDLDFFVLRLDWGVGLHLPYKNGFYNFDKFKDSQSIHFAIGYPF